MHSLRRILALMKKEFVLILKDPRSRFVVIGPPLIQFLIFGYAATYDLKDVSYAVFDESKTPESRELLARFEGSGNFKLVKALLSDREINAMIDPEKVCLVIHIGPEFARKIHSGRSAGVQVILDGRNSNVALIALSYINSIVAKYNADIVSSGRFKSRGPGLVLVNRSWFNRNLQSRWFIVSALGGIISMVVVMILTGLSVAREREFGTFDQLLVTPFMPGEILIGKSIPGMLFGLMDALIFSAGAVWWFGVPFRGTIPALVIVLACFILAIVGVGLLISSLSMTMQQALLGSFIFMMPAVVLSGFATPVENMPDWLQTATRLNPIRYVITALREIFLEGAGVHMLWPQIWPLLIMAAVMLPVAGWFFRHRAQ